MSGYFYESTLKVKSLLQKYHQISSSVIRKDCIPPKLPFSLIRLFSGIANVKTERMRLVNWNVAADAPRHIFNLLRSGCRVYEKVAEWKMANALIFLIIFFYFVVFVCCFILGFMGFIRICVDWRTLSDDD